MSNNIIQFPLPRHMREAAEGQLRLLNALRMGASPQEKLDAIDKKIAICRDLLNKWGVYKDGNG